MVFSFHGTPQTAYPLIGRRQETPRQIRGTPEGPPNTQRRDRACGYACLPESGAYGQGRVLELLWRILAVEMRI